MNLELQQLQQYGWWAIVYYSTKVEKLIDLFSFTIAAAKVSGRALTSFDEDVVLEDEGTVNEDTTGPTESGKW